VESVDEFRRQLTEKSDRDEKLGSRIAEISRQVFVSPIFFYFWAGFNRRRSYYYVENELLLFVLTLLLA